MKSIALLAAVSAAILLTSPSGASQPQDQTQVPGAKGKAVANAVVDRIRSRCVFPEDRLFLRRAAAVVSDDGTDLSTYRAGYHGGIWQIDEAAFNSTLSCTGYIASACSTIQSEFGINWRTVTWVELRKPLYSGLAATLVILKQLAGQDMPGDVASQAQKWAMMYNDPNNGQKYSSQAAQATATTCSDPTDIVFILDSSGSVSRSDFTLMLNFAANVVDLMGIATSDTVRVADVVFSSTADIEFDFDDYLNNPTGLKNAILNTYKSGGGTDTSEGLDVAASLLYNTGRGARSNAKKVAVLVTDGRSNNFPMTVQSATKLKDKGATLFAIGVGGYNKNELDAVASIPTCSHVLTLPNFAVITSILTEIQKSACEASYVISNETTSVGGELAAAGTETTTQTHSPSSPNKTIEASVKCGILDIYVSTTDPKPSSAVYEKKYKATDGSPAVLSVVDSLPSGTPVYITVVGTRLPADLAALKNCTDYSWSLDVKEKPEVICKVGGVSRPCTANDLNLAGLCTPAQESEPDMDYATGGSNGVNMTGGIITIPSLGGNKTVVYPSATGQPLPAGVSNPCTPQNLNNDRYYHAYSADETRFIQCNEQGGAFLMQCQPNTKWSQTKYTCVHAVTTPASLMGTASGPCTHDGQFIGDRCSPSKYYVCTSLLSPVEMSCSAGLHFNSALSVCDWPANVQWTKDPSCP